MSKADIRKHGGNTPGMVGARGHERHEEPVRLNHPEPGEDQPGMKGQSMEATGDMHDRHQPSTLGSETATTTGTARTPDDERDS